jgi:deoxyribonuclease V
MIACVDVDYRDSEAIAVCVLFQTWDDGFSADEKVERIPKVAPYEPGQFYRRELPCLLAVLARVRESLEAVVVDGYVWLGDEQKPGLGAHLYEALGRTIPVIGVAKTRFMSATAAPVKRGKSERPLYVTAAGIDLEVAVRHIQNMHGRNRLPTLLKRVDRLCRDSLCTPAVLTRLALVTQAVNTSSTEAPKSVSLEPASPGEKGSETLTEPNQNKSQEQTKAWWQFWK